MHLNRLEMYGFKSFANKIEIEFGNGITGIVGPNGSGKSNISDAIRWVLGEQNVRNIRGNQIADVIFKGSSTRRAAGVAEVLLNFENDGDLPVEFKEIDIQRKIFRTGESEFYINRSRCRLKDISDLFADTGIGIGGISIISQNRVDDILKAKPEERRVFFEETIGITKYRNRKRETLHRIEDTEANLIRAADIINEIETQLNPLKLQAERTNKYNALEMERRTLTLTILNRRHQKLADELEEKSQSHQYVSDNLIELQTKLNTEEAVKERLNKEVNDVENNLQRQSEQNESIRQQFDITSAEITRLKERQNQGQLEHSRFKKDQQKLLADIESSNGNLSLLKETLSKQREEFTDQQRILKDTQKEHSKLESLLQTKNAQRRNSEKQLSELQQKITRAQNEARIVDHDLTTFNKNQQSYKKNEDKLTAELEQLNKEHESLTAQQQSNDEEYAQIKSQQDDFKHSLDSEVQKNKKLQSEQEQQSRKLQAVESRLQILKRMEQNYEGFARAPKAVLMSKEPWRSKIYGAVGELFVVPQKFTTAIEIALGSSVQNIVTEDEETAKSAIEFLKRAKLGRATFLPLSRISPYTTLRRVEDIGAIGFASELVQIEPKLQKIADFLLSRTLIVDTIDNALKIARRHNVRIVTLEGEVLNVGGSISGGSSKQIESNIFSRSDEIKTLTADLISGQDSLEHIKQQYVISNDKLLSINKNIDELNKKLNALDVKSAENRVTIKQLEKSIKEKQNELNKLINSLKGQSQSIAELQENKQNYIDIIDSLNNELESLKIHLNNNSTDLNETEEKTQNLSKKLKKLEIDSAVNEQKIIRTENQFELLQSKISNDESTLKNLRTEEKALLKNLSNNAILLTKLIKENELTQTRLEQGQEQVKFMYAAKMEKQAESVNSEKVLRDLNRQVTSSKNQLHNIELAISQLQMKIEDCEDKIRAESDPNNEELTANSDLTEEAISNRLTAIEAELIDIGTVNPNAPQEYEELYKRHTFLNQQLNDLKKAKENLQALITEMDEKIVAQFIDAFQKIQIFFSEIFIKLFGGGVAKLELTDKDDILNTGVEITVTLPKKRRQSLSMLSGGERALTVIALLFSFLKFRPSPFCILDEVDAPLDEANLVRFGDFLREFSKNTQFILITHRKTTMEFLDRIYGITVEEAGISKVLSVNLKHAEQLN
ncbi:MAG: chromosome segregation protein SMC [Selenomonadaceae bacterium]|nr:chromosome segregation protein SMC [Selenomonadaceae bacterium]